MCFDVSTHFLLPPSPRIHNVCSEQVHWASCFPPSWALYAQPFMDAREFEVCVWVCMCVCVIIENGTVCVGVGTVPLQCCVWHTLLLLLLLHPLCPN